MVDVIDDTLTVSDIHQCSQHRYDVFFIECATTCDLITTETTVELHSTNARQVVTICREEQVLEKVLSRLLRGRLARAHHAIDFNQRLELSPRAVTSQRIGDKRTAIDLIGVNRFDRLDAFLTQAIQYFFGQLAIALEQDFTTGSINNRLRNTTTNEVLIRHRQEFNACIFQLTDVARCNTTTALYKHRVTRHNVKGSHITLQALGHQSHGR